MRPGRARLRWGPVVGAALLVVLAAGGFALYRSLSGDDRGRAVHPVGAPYSYRVPVGFRIDHFNSSYFRANPPGPDLSVLDVHKFSLTPTDVTFDRILVDAERGQEPLAGNELLAAVQQQARQEITQRGGDAGGFERTPVDGRDAVRYSELGLRLRAGGGGNHTYLVDEVRYEISDGAVRVSVTCQWRQADRFTDTLSKGCADLVRTLHLS
jgi:hypothetical protein